MCRFRGGECRVALRPQIEILWSAISSRQWTSGGYQYIICTQDYGFERYWQHWFIVQISSPLPKQGGIDTFERNASHAHSIADIATQGKGGMPNLRHE